MKVVCSYGEVEESPCIRTGDLINLCTDWWMVTGGKNGYSIVSMTDGIHSYLFDTMSELQQEIESQTKLVLHENFLKSSKVKLEIKRR